MEVQCPAGGVQSAILQIRCPTTEPAAHPAARREGSALGLHRPPRGRLSGHAWHVADGKRWLRGVKESALDSSSFYRVTCTVYTSCKPWCPSFGNDLRPLIDLN